MHRIFELACNKFIKERLKITFFFKYSRFGIGTKKGSRDKSIYLTKLMWTPRLRWAAEQSMQRKIPYVTEAHVGFLALQSKHIWNKRNEGKTMKSGERKYEIWRYRSRSAIFRTRSRRTKQFRAGEKGGRVPCFRTWIWAFWKWRSCRLRFRMPWPQNREGERERERDFSSSLFLSREEVRGVRPGIALVLWGRKTNDKGFNALSLPLRFALALSLLRSTKNNLPFPAHFLRIIFLADPPNPGNIARSAHLNNFWCPMFWFTNQWGFLSPNSQKWGELTFDRSKSLKNKQCALCKKKVRN